MGGLIERLIMVDAKDAAARHGGAESADLGRKKTRANVRKNGERAETMMVRQVYAHRGPVNFRVFPGNREEDGRVAKGAEVVAIVRVLPQIVGIDNQESSKGLLKPGIELIALARADGRLETGATDYVEDDRVGSAEAREDQVFIEGRFENTRIGNAKHAAGFLEVVRHAHAGLRLPIVDDAAVHVGARANVERPMAFGDLVLQIGSDFLYVRVAVKGKERSSTRQIERKELAAGSGYGLTGDRVEARIAVGVGLRRKEVRIGNSEIEIFREESMLKSGACLEVMNSLLLGDIGPQA